MSQVKNSFVPTLLLRPVVHLRHVTRSFLLCAHVTYITVSVSLSASSLSSPPVLTIVLPSRPTDKGPPPRPSFSLIHAAAAVAAPGASPFPLLSVPARSLARALSFSPRRRRRRRAAPSLLPPLHPFLLPSFLPSSSCCPADGSPSQEEQKAPRVQRMKNGRHEQGDRHAHALQRVVAAEVCASCHREA